MRKIMLLICFTATLILCAEDVTIPSEKWDQWKSKLEEWNKYSHYMDLALDCYKSGWYYSAELYSKMAENKTNDKGLRTAAKILQSMSRYSRGDIEGAKRLLDSASYEVDYETRKFLREIEKSLKEVHK